MSGRNFFDDLHFYAGQDVGVAAGVNAPSPNGMTPCPPNPNAGPQLPPRGPDTAQSSTVRMIFPPRIEKLAASIDFQAANYSLVIAAGAGKTVVVPGFQLSTGQIGWLQTFSLYTLAPTADTQLIFTVRVNGSPVAGYDNYRNPPGIANLVYLGVEDMRIRVPGGATVDLLITNTNAFGPWTVGGDLSGWYHPESAEVRAWNLDV